MTKIYYYSSIFIKSHPSLFKYIIMKLISDQKVCYNVVNRLYFMLCWMKIIQEKLMFYRDKYLIRK